MKDKKGVRFGKLKVIKKVGVDRWRHTIWLCKCDCGGTSTPTTNNLRSGISKSCGCLRGGRVDIKRMKEIEKLRKRGLTFQQIGNKFGVSRQAIQQLLKLNN